MARPAKTKTKLEDAAEKAAVKMEAAKVEDGKKSTTATQEILKKATADFETADTAAKRERFELTVGGRVSRSLAIINSVAKGASLKAYNFTADDVTKLHAALNEAVEAVKADLTAALSSSTAKPKTVFKF